MLREVIRVVDLGMDDKLLVSEGAAPTEVPPEGVRRWLDISGDVAPALEPLRAVFDFHPLAIEDCRQFDQRPKMEEYRDHLFLVTQGFSLPASSGELGLHE